MFCYLRITYYVYKFQNCFSGVTIILIGCAGSVTTLKAQGFLLLSLVVAIVNLVNLVVLEVGEWRGFLTSEDRNFIKVIRDYKVERNCMRIQIPYSYSISIITVKYRFLVLLILLARKVYIFPK